MAAFCTAILATVPAAAGSPTASAAAEDLVSYLTKGKLKLGKQVTYQMVCSVDCQVTVTNDLAVKGSDLAPLINTGTFSAGQVIISSVGMNKGLRNDIAANIGSSKLITEVKGTSVATGESDTDSRTFQFKRSGKKKK